jgi:putative endonuclease
MGRGNLFSGRAGEKAAVRLLKRRGYRIIGTNIRTPFGELDIVARHKGAMVFAEVKSRLSHSLGPPFLSVTTAKQRHIIKNALYYLKRNGLIDSAWRIDVVSVKLNHDYEVENVEIIENAVEEPYDC